MGASGDCSRTLQNEPKWAQTLTISRPTEARSLELRQIAIGRFGIAFLGFLLDDDLNGVAPILVQQVVDRTRGARARTTERASPFCLRYGDDQQDHHGDAGDLAKVHAQILSCEEHGVSAFKRSTSVRLKPDTTSVDHAGRAKAGHYIR